MSILSYLINRVFASADKKRDQGLQTPPDVERRDDLSYGPHGKWNLLDVYLPRERPARLPLIVNIHGGGWVYGTKEVYQFYGMSLAQRGFAVVNFNYRLAPANRFPAPLEDLNRVMHWIHTQAGELPFDLQRIYFVGDSAGANLAALYASLCTNPDYARGFDFRPPEGFAPRALALNCGVYDTQQMNGGAMGLMRGIFKDYLGPHYTAADLERINTCRQLTAAFPPTYLMTAEHDLARPQAPFMEAKLKELGIRYTFKMYGVGQKEIGHVFHCNVRLAEAALCNDEECAFFHSV